MPKGFTFAPNCLEFKVSDTLVSFSWIKKIGTQYVPSMGNFVQVFYKVIDPTKNCTGIFNTAFAQGQLSKDDIYFYLLLRKNYYQGIIATKYVSFDTLNLSFTSLVNAAVNIYGINPNKLGKLLPIPNKFSNWSPTNNIFTL